MRRRSTLGYFCNRVARVRPAVAQQRPEAGGTWMNAIRAVLVTFALFASSLLSILIGVARADTTVDCGNGDTIADALQGNDVVYVKGTCHEHVTISNPDVQLLADPAGGTISGPNPAVNTITVTANRVTIDGLTVTGGRNGIHVLGAAAFTARNCVVQNTGRSGVVFFKGSSGNVDTCILQNNPLDGSAVSDSSSATITGSTLSRNGRYGVLFFSGASGRIGITDVTQCAGNTISNNGSHGVSVQDGGSAFVGGNTISGNGTNTSLPVSLRAGVAVFRATADLVGDNTIRDNAGAGIHASQSKILVGNPGICLSGTNTITANGFPAGVFAFNGSSLMIRGATISNNAGNGVTLSLRSQADMFDDTIQNNANGILLLLGSGLFLEAPPVTVTNNPQFGLLCLDGSSRFSGPTTGIHDNGPPGQQQVSCDPF